ncbi:MULTISPECIES: hypothetical protein [unclassified Streptomyces]|uniref:hypothetical protein n=1 Tax=unclassified Streptomyces TaxID=2593676 RepID=UPI004043550D
MDDHPLTPRRPVPRPSRLRSLLGSALLCLVVVAAASAPLYIGDEPARYVALGALGVTLLFIYVYGLGLKSRAETHRVAEGRERVREAEEGLERALRPAYGYAPQAPYGGYPYPAPSGPYGGVTVPWPTPPSDSRPPDGDRPGPSADPQVPPVQPGGQYPAEEREPAEPYPYPAEEQEPAQPQPEPYPQPYPMPGQGQPFEWYGQQPAPQPYSPYQPGPGLAGSRLSLPELWAVTHRRLDLYHEIALGQAARSFRNAQVAMVLGFLLLAVFVVVALRASTTAGSVVAGGLGAVAAALAGYVSRTFIRSQEAAAGHLRAYFEQPLEFSRYLAAERLVAEAALGEQRRAEVLGTLVEAMVAGGSRVPESPAPARERGAPDSGGRP